MIHFDQSFENVGCSKIPGSFETRYKVEANIIEILILVIAAFLLGETYRLFCVILGIDTEFWIYLLIFI